MKITKKQIQLCNLKKIASLNKSEIKLYKKQTNKNLEILIIFIEF